MCEQYTGPSSRLRRNTLIPESIATTIPRAQPNLHQTFFFELTSGDGEDGRMPASPPDADLPAGPILAYSRRLWQWGCFLRTSAHIFEELTIFHNQ